MRFWWYHYAASYAMGVFFVYYYHEPFVGNEWLENPSMGFYWNWRLAEYERSGDRRRYTAVKRDFFYDPEPEDAAGEE